MLDLRFRLAFLAVLAFTLLAALGCDSRPPPILRDGGGGGGDAGPPGGGCTAGTAGVICRGNQAVMCLENGEEGTVTNCATSGQTCVSGTGCAACSPGTFRCNGDTVEQCNPDGSGYTASATCDSAAGEMCNAVAGRCTSACDDAVQSNSYIGCEYWPTPGANAVASQFDFAVVAVNPQSTMVTVTVTRGGSQVAQQVVAPGSLATIRLPWIDELKTATGSTIVANGAYQLTSTLPVTVYQFSPLEYRIDVETDFFLGDLCDGPDDDTSDGQCFSFSNDASLLLPVHILTGNYLLSTRGTRHAREVVFNETDNMQIRDGWSSVPGLATITATAPGQTTVSVQSTAHVLAGDGVAALTPGESGSYMLNQGDVLQILTGNPGNNCNSGTTSMDSRTVDTECPGPGLFETHPCTVTQTYTYCDLGPNYNLTGTRIRASQPVAVTGGHVCDFIPNNRFACDHVEESQFPLESWGADFIVSVTEPLEEEPNVITIVSGADGNMLTFDPPSVQANTTLNNGQSLTFEAFEDFRVTGSAALMVTQYLVGQDYSAGLAGAGGEARAGDPGMSFAIPTEQFRTEYTFLAPSTFERSFVNVTAPAGAEVLLSSNGGAATAVTGWRAVGATGMQTARVEIQGGTHSITSSQGFGIVVYGFGSYTSYIYPGGLDFEEINPLI